jgi:hypothetical protein
MADMSASTSKAGPSLPKHGRPRNEEGITRIKLRKDVYQIWLARKDSLGFSTKTHSEFAMHLLLNITEDEYESNLSSPGVGKWKLKHIFILLPMLCVVFLIQYLYSLVNSAAILEQRLPMHSTPHKTSRIRTDQQPLVSPISCPGDVVNMSKVEGVSALNISRMESVSQLINNEFGLHFGDPSSENSSSSETESDLESDKIRY